MWHLYVMANSEIRMFRRLLINTFGLRLFRAGDVVIDRFDGKKVTLERVTGSRAEVFWFDRTKLKRGSLNVRHIKLA